MGTGAKKKKLKFLIFNSVDEEPVGSYVAFPEANIITG